MSEADTKRSGKRLIGALVATVIVVGAFAAAYALLGGDELLSDLLGGSGAEPAKTAPGAKPSKPTSPTPSMPSGTPTRTAEVTETAEPTATAPEPSGGSSGGSASAAVTPPTADQAARMYWEQVASQEQIGRLVRGEVRSVAFGTVSVSGGAATVPLTVSYTDGSSLSGRMVLRKYGNAWYFSSISRTGSSAAVTTGKSADLGVVSTIVSQQASNQDLVAGIVSGAYKTCTVNGVSSGSGTATVKITLSGGSASPVPGRITCISKIIDGTKHWFVTAFAKN